MVKSEKKMKKKKVIKRMFSRQITVTREKERKKMKDDMNLKGTAS